MKKISYLKKPISFRKIRDYNDLCKRGRFGLANSPFFVTKQKGTMIVKSSAFIKAANQAASVVNLNTKGGYFSLQDPVRIGSPHGTAYYRSGTLYELPAKDSTVLDRETLVGYLMTPALSVPSSAGSYRHLFLFFFNLLALKKRPFIVRSNYYDL